MTGEPIKPHRGDVAAQAGGAVPQAGTSTAEDIAAFVAKARALSPHAPGAKGRLIFALDATMSRQPTWDMACALQADMFRETATLGSLDIRLVYYRGLNECRGLAKHVGLKRAGHVPGRLPAHRRIQCEDQPPLRARREG